jgi:subtilisin family serine protease
MQADCQRCGTSNWCSGSNYGANSVHLFAPGRNVVTTYPYNSENRFPPYHGWYSITSAAAPHVAGVAALLYSHYYEVNGRFPNAAQVRGAILAGV